SPFAPHRSWATARRTQVCPEARQPGYSTFRPPPRRGLYGGDKPSAGSAVRFGEELPRPQGEPELHPIERRGEVAPRELLHLAHPVAERVPMDEQLGRGRLPAGVVLQERPERRLHLTPVLPVVGIERSEERVREGAQRVGLRHGQQEAIRPKV